MTSQIKTETLSDAELKVLMKPLGFRCLSDEGLDEFLSDATKHRWSHKTLLAELAARELRERERRSLERRQRDSKIGNFRPIADFDWNWPKKLDRAVIEYLVSADFVAKGENAVLVGNQGLGKTMIAKNILHNAVHKGHSALFVQAAQMLVDLGTQDSAGALERRLRYYIKPKLLCIDEVGYLSYDQRAADLLFQIVSRRYEEKSIVITTNLAFKDWPTVFPGATSVASLIDRLIHHSEITLIEGDSFRKHQAKKRKDERAMKRGDK
jgi:DNA replication protein DnaC